MGRGVVPELTYPQRGLDFDAAYLEFRGGLFCFVEDRTDKISSRR